MLSWPAHFPKITKRRYAHNIMCPSAEGTWTQSTTGGPETFVRIRAARALQCAESLRRSDLAEEFEVRQLGPTIPFEQSCPIRGHERSVFTLRCVPFFSEWKVQGARCWCFPRPHCALESQRSGLTREFDATGLGCPGEAAETLRPSCTSQEQGRGREGRGLIAVFLKTGS